MKGLQDEGVDTSRALRAPHARGSAKANFVDPETGDRIIHHFPGAGLDEAKVSDLDLSVLDGVAVVLMDDWWLQAGGGGSRGGARKRDSGGSRH